MKPAAVSHVLMKIEHRFTSFIELLFERVVDMYSSSDIRENNTVKGVTAHVIGRRAR